MPLFKAMLAGEFNFFSVGEQDQAEDDLTLMPGGQDTESVGSVLDASVEKGALPLSRPRDPHRLKTEVNSHADTLTG
jgi:hypothetical protein